MADDPPSLQDIIAHFGIRGMKWGVRRADPSSSVAPSEDSAKATELRQKIRVGGTKSLSNTELQQVITRLNLETQYAGLREREPTKLSSGHNAVKKILGVAATISQIHTVVKGPLGQAIAKRLTKQ